MSAKSDFYNILGISEGATRQQARAAFLQLALRFHPDRNGSPIAEQKMKEVTEAYAEAMHTLPDMKASNASSSAMNSRKQSLTVVKRDLYYRLNISTKDALNGATKTIYVPTIGACQTCNGRGIVNGDVCDGCYGVRVVSRMEKFVLAIPSGIQSGVGKQFRLQGEKETDLHVYVAIDPDQPDSDESDIYCEVPIGLRELGTNGEVSVPTTDGIEKLRIPKGTPPDTIFLIRGKGLPNGEGGKGDLLVRIVT